MTTTNSSSNPSVNDPDVFADTDRCDIDITESDLLGTHTFKNILYTGESNLVNAVTEKTPEDLDESVKEAKEAAERLTDDGDPPRIPRAKSGEEAFETRSSYSISPFFHRRITGGLDWHTVFRKAWESDAYLVDHETNYQTGTLTITVTEEDQT